MFNLQNISQLSETVANLIEVQRKVEAHPLYPRFKETQAAFAAVEKECEEAVGKVYEIEEAKAELENIRKLAVVNLSSTEELRLKVVRRNELLAKFDYDTVIKENLDESTKEWFRLGREREEIEKKMYNAKWYWADGTRRKTHREICGQSLIYKYNQARGEYYDISKQIEKEFTDIQLPSIYE